MGHKIEFPHNDRVYFERAVGYFATDELDKALECMEMVQNNRKNAMGNTLYTFLLYTQERYEEALDVANDLKSIYIEYENYTLLYAQVLIKNQLFIEAELLIQEGLTEGNPGHREEWESIEIELENEREHVRLELEAEKERVRNALSDLASYSPIKQSEIIDNALVLDLDDLQEFAPAIFSNPMVSQMTQRAYLELLIENQDNSTYYFPWFNQQKEIIPNNLVRFDQVEIIKSLDNNLEQKTHKLPSLLEMVKVEMMNDLLLLYPFIEEVVTDMDYWVDCYISVLDYSKQLDVDAQPETAEQEQIKEWVQKFHQMANRVHLSQEKSH